METYHGHVRTPADAIILFEACRLGVLPRVSRRLSEKERQCIKSGSVFVWDEREAGMRRWTDGKSWSASRVSGSFLTYREMEGKRGGSNFGGSALNRAGKTPDSTRGSDSDVDGAGEDGQDGYRYKPDGLMKQSFSITTSTGNHLHLISYHSRQSGMALQPTQDPALRHVRPPKGMYPETNMNDQAIPPVTRTPMVTPPMSHMHPSTYPRGGPQIFHGASPMGPWIQPSGYPYPPTSVPHQQQQQQQPYPQQAYPYPQSGSNMPHPGMKPMYHQHPPAPDSRNRLPPAVGHQRTGSQGSQQAAYPPQPLISQNKSNSPILSKMDPRLTAPLSLAHGQILPGLTRDPTRAHTRSPSPATRRDQSTTPTSRDTALTSTSLNSASTSVPIPGTNSSANSIKNSNSSTSASTIPSIGALVNGALEYEAKAVSRSSSKSPGRQGEAAGTSIPPAAQLSTIKGPQDIPHSKIGFAGEDIRALRVLDRAFKT